MTLLSRLAALVAGHADTRPNQVVLLHTILERIETMAVSLDKLTADVSAAVALIGTLRTQVDALTAAASAGNTDPATQAAINKLSATLEAAETNPVTSSNPPPSGAPTGTQTTL